jgi:hypothetical protein
MPWSGGVGAASATKIGPSQSLYPLRLDQRVFHRLEICL